MGARSGNNYLSALVDNTDLNPLIERVNALLARAD